MSVPSLSVVIPSRDGRSWLARCLPALLADLGHSAEAEVIVVDDDSVDGTGEWLRARFPDVRVVELGIRLGFAAACNTGARAAAAPVVAFLNNDAEVIAGWSRALQDTLNACPEAVIVGGLTLFDGAGGRTVNSAGVRIGPAAAAGDLGFGLPLELVDLRPREVAGVSGVSMAVRSEWFAATGGFDERLFMYSEDVELCVRAWLEGHTVRFVPGAVVRHVGGASSGERYGSLRNYYGSRNRLLVAAACLDLPAAVCAVPLLLGQDLITVLALMAAGNFGLAARTAAERSRGVIDGLRLFAAARRERRRRRPLRRRSFAELRSMGVIEPWRDTLREFARLRRRELRRAALARR